ncbi:MAG: endonuclease III [Bacteroidales bacterium]|nr:endonuclease III [Bacteroidales bacterium]
MKKEERFQRFIDYFSVALPQAETELHYDNPFQLLVAVILSAQCTDKRVNKITTSLFQRFPTAEVMAKSSVEEIFSFIKSCSYPNNKAKHLLGMSQKLMQDFNGVVPSDMESLMTLPGVGRKTANVMETVAFDIPAMPVDTHVFRVSARIGLSENAKTPLQTEQQLVANIPQKLLGLAHHWLILHGRYKCLARKPQCETCGAQEFCRYFEEKQK